jgi:purine-binding chemotaxis protein CheW
MTQTADKVDPDVTAREAREAVLVERSRRLAKVATTEPEGHSVSILVFRLGGESYAVDVAALRSIEPVGSLTPLPCAPRFVAGVLNLRGEMLTVLDLGAVLDLPQAPASAEARVLVTDVPGAVVGMLVDSVADVQTVAPAGSSAHSRGANSPAGSSKAASLSWICSASSRRSVSPPVRNWARHLGT